MNKLKLCLLLLAFILSANFSKSFAQTEEPSKEKKIKFTLPKNAVIVESKEVIIPSVVIPPPPPPETIKSDKIRTNAAIENVAAQEAIPDGGEIDEESYENSITDLESLKKACEVNPLKIYALQLSDESYKSFPEEVFNFKNLKRLDIRGNNIKFLPESIHQLKSLKRLTIISQVPELPDSLFYLTELEELNIGTNITILNPKIGQLTKLKKLSMPAVEIPASIKNLVNLEVLQINGYNSSYQSQTIEESLKNVSYLSNLKELSLEIGISQIPVSFKNLKNLEKLSLSFYKNVTLNDVFEGLNSLKEISLKRGYQRNETGGDEYNERVDGNTNKVILTLPNSFGNLTNLTKFYITELGLNNLENGFKNLQNLEDLTIYNSNIISLPSSISNSINLKTLNITNSGLEKLPLEINKLTKLTNLTLSNNKLTELPDISNLGQLKILKYW